MDWLVGIAVVIMISMTSPANGSTTTQNPTAIAIQHQTAIPNVQAPVKHRRILKSKIQRAQPFGIDDTDDVFVQEEDLAAGYRRRDLTRIEHPDGISEKVRWRLFLARQLALMKYREKWT